MIPSHLKSYAQKIFDFIAKRLPRARLVLAFKFSLSIILCVVANFAFFQYFTSLPFLPHAVLLSIISSVLIIQDTVGKSYNVFINRIEGILIGNLISAFTILLFGFSYPLTIVAVLLTIIFSSIFGVMNCIRIAIVNVIIITLPSIPEIHLDKFESIMILVSRIISISIGTIIGGIITRFIFPNYESNILHKNVVQFLNDVIDVFQVITLNILSQHSWDPEQKINQLNNEINNLIKQNINNMDGLEVEFKDRKEVLESWIGLLENFKDINYQFKILLKTHKQICHFIDEELRSTIDNTFDSIEFSLITLREKIQNKTVEEKYSFEYNIEILHQKQNEFQEKKSKDLSIEDRENFFLFFYVLKTINYLIKEAEKKIVTIF